MEISGVTTDLPVADVERARPFYSALLGREPDFQPNADIMEWRLIKQPEVTLRIVQGRTGVPIGQGRIGLGVDDLAAERTRLAALLPGTVPEPTVRPGIIASCPIRDPEGNTIVVWQDLLPPRGVPSATD